MKFKAILLIASWRRATTYFYYLALWLIHHQKPSDISTILFYSALGCLLAMPILFWYLRMWADVRLNILSRTVIVLLSPLLGLITFEAMYFIFAGDFINPLSIFSSPEMRLFAILFGTSAFVFSIGFFEWYRKSASEQVTAPDTSSGSR